MARLPFTQLAVRLFCTSSITWPRSLTRTGEPLRQATIRSPKSFAFASWPLACTVDVRLAPHRMPVGRFTLPALIALDTSSIPTWCAFSAWGLRRTRTAYFWAP